MKGFRARHLISLCVMLFLFIRCGKDEIPFDRENPVLGNWEFTVSSEEPSYTLYHMKRTAEFQEKYGSLFFGGDNEFLYRSSWGFAGQILKVSGTWSALNDTLIQVEIGQPFPETWKIAIKKVNRETMEYYYIYNQESTPKNDILYFATKTQRH